MGLVLVNTAPGADVEPVKPGQPLQFGLKSQTLSVIFGTLRQLFGLSDVVHEGLLPENDPNLTKLGATVKLQTSEHRLPVNVAVPRSLSAGSIVFTKGTNSDNDQGIYEVHFPVTPGASVLASFTFRTNTSWTQFNPDWLNVTNAVGMYFGLEHGTYNTALYTFLRSTGGGHGQMVIGGPLQAFTTSRPGQQSLPLDWLALPNNSQIKVWIFFNAAGYPAPFTPAYTPLVEVWTQRIGTDLAPVIQAQIPIGTFGQFQTFASNFPNWRPGFSEEIVLYFGNVGRTGDVLQIDDWEIFPDFRLSVNEGQALPNCARFALPDGPVSYRADSGLQPDQSVPGKWLTVPDSGFILPAKSFLFQPGRKLVPQAARITKTINAASGFQKTEPRMGQHVDGMMIEAHMQGNQTSRADDAYGAGISVDDGVKLFRAVLLQTATFSTIGISETVGTAITNFYVPVDNLSNPVVIDWTTLHLVRLVVDRHRNKVALFVDENRLLEVSLGGTFPASLSGSSRAMFGHIVPIGSQGTADFAFVNYLNRYKAWEIVDQVLPESSTPAFTLVTNGLGTTNLNPASPNAVELQIKKPEFSSPPTHNYYQLLDDFADSGGFSVDFQARVVTYTGFSGEAFKSLTWAGCGVRIHLGNKLVDVGFYDAGAIGRVIGVVPGSGSTTDIINQTPLGQKFSAGVDWTQSTFFRIVYKAFDSIQIWSRSVAQAPILTIPWRNDTDGFDLPLDLGSPSIQFGHFDGLTSSTTAWTFVRYGQSNGYEVAVQQSYPNGLPAYLFGGRVFESVTFDE